jgi:hypothetical protein
MNALDAARRIADRLDEGGIPYAIGGALALGVWGLPRATVDVDLTTFVDEARLPSVLDALERAGVMLDRAAAARDVSRIGLFKGRIGRVVVDVFLSQHPQYEVMRTRRVRVKDPAGRGLWFISAEDLCVHKIIYGRTKDIADLESLVAVRPELDLVYVRGWIEQMVPPGDRRLGILAELERRRQD